jgi:hypothetical protein
MSQTKAQRKKQQKSKSREKQIKKNRNILRNVAVKRFRLDVHMGDDWKIGVRQWSNIQQVEAHRVETEARRAKGEEILMGRVIDMAIGNGKVILNILGSTPKPKGMAPDKITDGAKAWDCEYDSGTK